MFQIDRASVFFYSRTASEEYTRMDLMPTRQPPSYVTLYGSGASSLDQDCGLPEVSVHTGAHPSQNLPTEHTRPVFLKEHKTDDDSQ